MPRRAPPGAPVLNRTTATTAPAKPVAIFCEGATEESCLKALRGHWRVPAVSVFVAGQQGVPRSVVEAARRYVKDLGAAAKPVVVVVFDRDEHPSWDDALEMARGLGYIRAVSNPCIELWGILLHQDQTASLERKVAQSALSALHPGYHHERHPYFDISVVLGGLAAAERRAAALDARAAAVNPPYSNPTTSFSSAIATFRP